MFWIFATVTIKQIKYIKIMNILKNMSSPETFDKIRGIFFSKCHFEFIFIKCSYRYNDIGLSV